MRTETFTFASILILQSLKVVKENGVVELDYKFGDLCSFENSNASIVFC